MQISYPSTNVFFFISRLNCGNFGDYTFTSGLTTTEAFHLLFIFLRYCSINFNGCDNSIVCNIVICEYINEILTIKIKLQK